MRPHLVLASGSPYRRRLLADAGYEFAVVVPGVDEAATQARLGELGPEGVALALARQKAGAVADAGAVVLAADQVGVLDGPTGLRLLTKPATPAAAVAQLTAMAGTTHRLVNGIVVVGPGSAQSSAVDVQVVEMADFDEAAARRYVDRFRPFDTAGGYRIEDDAGLVAAVRGSGADGVMGLPVEVVAGLLARHGIGPTAPGGGGRGR